MKKLIPILFLAVIAFTSCKDDGTTPDDTTTTLTTAEKIQHTWNITSIMDFNFVGATTTLDYIDTVDVGTSTVDFRVGNMAYINLDGDLDTVDYQVINDQTIKFDGDVFDINTLTTSEFKVTYSERTDTPYYDNVVLFNR
jgi:hypothetical protein